MMELGNMLFGHSYGAYELDRDLFDEIMWEGLEKCGCDSYGHLDDEELEEYRNHRGGISTEIFETYPYWWGDDDDEKECNRPNFIYIPEKLEIRWYKYALRDAYANHEVEPEELVLILKKCARHIADLKKGK